MSATDIETLLRQLVQADHASDLIITVGQPPQLRICNELTPLNDVCLSPDDTERLCLSLLDKEQTQRFLRDKELDISYAIEGSGRFRINMYRQQRCLAMAARVIRDRIPDFEELRLPDVIRKFATFQRGLVLITGPIGSGKTTTVAAMVDYINRTRKCHIVCIEDPIEYAHSHVLATVDQREVGIDTKSFAEALRRVLRQSMDVVVIGEIRDRISAQAALTLAETGHLTLATLHTNGTVASVNRLVDMFPPEQICQIRTQLAASLAGVIWQQLLPSANDNGLVVACEIMKATTGIRSMIRHGKMHEIYSAIESGKQYEMWTMKQAMEQLVQDGLIDVEWLDKGSGIHAY
jgi:twitching motility protein PilT